MAQNKCTQTQEVIEALRHNGGFSTLGKLYGIVDTSSWKTKTPQASIRRIVQHSPEIFRIQPGLWALEECKADVLRKFELNDLREADNERFHHSYYQGLLVEIGNMYNLTTYVPAQDKNKRFTDRPLVEVCTTVDIPQFSYKEIVNRAKTVDVIWFNERQMPSKFFEVEHSTDIQNSVGKFCDLQDFNSEFYIVANDVRKGQFEAVMKRTAFKDVRDRVKFYSYEKVIKQYELMCEKAKFTFI